MQILHSYWFNKISTSFLIKISRSHEKIALFSKKQLQLVHCCMAPVMNYLGDPGGFCFVLLYLLFQQNPWIYFGLFKYKIPDPRLWRSLVPISWGHGSSSLSNPTWDYIAECLLKDEHLPSGPLWEYRGCPAKCCKTKTNCLVSLCSVLALIQKPSP